MIDYSNDLNYSRSRLENTIVSHKTRGPVVICEFQSFDHIIVRSIKENDGIIVSFDELDLVPVKLGMVDYNNSAIFTCRLPLRNDWRQGLRNNNFRSYRVATTARVRNPEYGYLYSCITNQYKKLHDIIELINSGVGIKSLSREFALSENKIYYKNRGEVGTFKYKNKTIKYELNKSFTWLEELLDERIENACT